MYFNILKKDLKRKKAMNIILLIFIILASTFVSSSVNNILTITSALDDYFEKAGMQDYFVAVVNKALSGSVEETFDKIEAIDSYGSERVFYVASDNFIYNGETLENMSNSGILSAFEEAQINFFDDENNVLKEVKPGTVYLSGKAVQKYGLETGESLGIKCGNTVKTLEIAGSFKDPFLGSQQMGMTRFLLNEKDFNELSENEENVGAYGGSICYIRTKDVAAVEKALSQDSGNFVVFACDKAMVKTTYIMDVIIAGVFLVVSICLILIAFAILRFTISFTISEEFREIGVMKAIGIQNPKIRGLYMMKYLALALIGSAIGFFVSVPFGNMLMQSVSQSIVMETENNVLINALCSAAVLLITVLFCMLCTRRVKKLTPIDAIRNGSTGERFKKKGIMHMSKNPLKPSSFMALNDVLSNPGRFGIIILNFMLCLALVLILVNTINTLESDSLITTMGMSECDVCYTDESKVMSYMTADGGREKLEKELEGIEKKLADNGIPAECFCEIAMKLSVAHGENSIKVFSLQGTGITCDRYGYFEGTPPQNADEVALTRQTAEKLGVQIGDTVTIRQVNGEGEYMVTALYQSMNNMGEGVRLHESADFNYAQASGALPFQIKFTDNPGKTEISRRIENMKELFGSDKINTAGETVSKMTGTEGMLDGVKTLVLAIVMLIIMLITFLMERSFIAKERGEIALLKAVGFKNGAIIKWHTMRFGISAVVSSVIALALIIPLTELTVGPIFKMMGADYGIKYEIVPLEVYLLYPLAVFAVTVVCAFLAAQNIRKIAASESSNIE